MISKKKYMFLAKYFRFLFLGVLFFFLLISGHFFYKINSNVEEAVAEVVKSKERSSSKSGSLALVDFFIERKTEIILLSELEAVKKLDEEEGIKALRLVLEHLEKKGGPLSGLIRTDENGILVWGVNKRGDKESLGLDISDREYFSWAKSQKYPGRIYISDPLIARGGMNEGKLIVTIVTPVFDDNEFDGLLLLSFPLKDLITRYIEQVAVLSSSKAYILNSNGDIIGASEDAGVGSNVFEFLKSKGKKEGDECWDLYKLATSGGEGASIHCFPLIEEEGKIRMITAFSPVEIDESKWSLIISSPYDYVKKLMSPLVNYTILIYILFMVGILLVFIVFIFSIRITQRDSFIKGFRKARNGFNNKDKLGKK
ncbi:cache domain-containing protein [Patescibacteria group bacterium]